MIIDNIKLIAKELSEGNIEQAAAAWARVEKTEDTRLEVIEVARQAAISHIKRGNVRTAREIKSVFGFSQEIIDETIKQAVLSAVAAGDMERVKKLKEELPITKMIGDQVIEYCVSWGRTDKVLALQTVFA